jgi:hypothetical protein
MSQHAKLHWHCGLHLGGIELKRFHAHEHKIGTLAAHSRPHMNGATWRGGFGLCFCRLGGRNRMLAPQIIDCFEHGPPVATLGHGVSSHAKTIAADFHESACPSAVALIWRNDQLQMVPLAGTIGADDANQNGVIFKLEFDVLEMPPLIHPDISYS